MVSESRHFVSVMRCSLVLNCYARLDRVTSVHLAYGMLAIFNLLHIKIHLLILVYFYTEAFALNFSFISILDAQFLNWDSLVP